MEDNDFSSNRRIILPNGDSTTVDDVVEDFVYFYPTDKKNVAASYGYEPEEFEEFVANTPVIKKLVDNTNESLNSSDIAMYKAKASLCHGISILANIISDEGQLAKDRISAVKVLSGIANGMTMDNKEKSPLVQLSLNLPNSRELRELALKNPVEIEES